MAETMKNKNILGLIFAVILGVSLHAYISEPEVIEISDCDVTEHARIKIALAECSDAAMICTWGEDYEETVLEE
jgi:hypothetical protein